MRRIFSLFFLCFLLIPLYSVEMNFLSGTSELTEESLTRLAIFKQEFEVFFRENPRTLIFVTGHTDNTGTDSFNKQLSLSRARLIREYLTTELRINPEYIKIFGKGASEPVADNSTEEGRYRNRRVEVVFERPEAQVKWLQNIVEYIPSKSGEILTAKPDDELFRYDKINTEDDSRSGIEFNDRNLLILEENSLMIIYGAITSSFSNLLEDKYHVELKYGGLYNKLQNMQDKSINIRTPAADLELYSSLHNVEFNESSTLTSVYEGYGLVMAQGDTIQVEEGYGIKIESGKEPEDPVKLPDTPTGFSITSTRPLLKGRRIVLGWEGSAETYLLEIAQDESFHDIYREYTVTENQLDIPLDHGSYFGRIQAVDKMGLKSDYSSTLIIDLPYQEFITFTGLDGEKTVISSKNFYRLAGAVIEQVDVIVNGESAAISEDRTFKKNIELAYGLNSLDVNAVLPDNSIKDYSFQISFQPEVDKTISFEDLRENVLNIVQTQEFTLIADASPYTRLFISGNEVLPDESGHFEHTLILEEGSNQINIAARFIDGSEQIFNFDVMYDKPDRSLSTLEIIAAITAVLVTATPLIIHASK